MWRLNCSLLLARVKKVELGKRFRVSVVVRRSSKHKIVGLLDQFKFYSSLETFLKFARAHMEARLLFFAC